MLSNLFDQRSSDGFAARSLQDRLLLAFADLVRERGYAGVTADDVASRVGCSREEFTTRFPTNEDCVLAMIDAAVKRAMSIGAAAYARAPDGWAHAAHLALIAMLEAFAVEPAILHVLVVEGPGAGPRSAAMIQAAPQAMALFLRPGYDEAAETTTMPAIESLAGMAVGGVMALVRQYVLDHRESEIPSLSTAIGLCGMAPMLGRDEAFRVMAECDAIHAAGAGGAAG